jgi:hypothetical protein
VTVAVNCKVCPAVKLPLAGLIDTVTTGVSVTVALADLSGSAALVAVTVNVWDEEIEAGAVYSPVEESVPRPDGDRLQVTC